MTELDEKIENCSKDISIAYNVSENYARCVIENVLHGDVKPRMLENLRIYEKSRSGLKFRMLYLKSRGIAYVF